MVTDQAAITQASPQEAEEASSSKNQQRLKELWLWQPKAQDPNQADPHSTLFLWQIYDLKNFPLEEINIFKTYNTNQSEK